MRKIREVLRLKFDAGLSVRKIAKSLSIGHSSAGDYLCRFAASGLQWPIDLSDAELNRRLISAGSTRAKRPTSDAGLGSCPRRVTPPRRHLGPAGKSIDSPNFDNIGGNRGVKMDMAHSR
jgi:hypothetical protein